MTHHARPGAPEDLAPGRARRDRRHGGPAPDRVRWRGRWNRRGPQLAFVVEQRSPAVPCWPRPRVTRGPDLFTNYVKHNAGTELDSAPALTLPA